MVLPEVLVQKQLPASLDGDAARQAVPRVAARLVPAGTTAQLTERVSAPHPALRVTCPDCPELLLLK